MLSGMFGVVVVAVVVPFFWFCLAFSGVFQKPVNDIPALDFDFIGFSRVSQKPLPDQPSLDFCEPWHT